MGIGAKKLSKDSHITLSENYAIGVQKAIGADLPFSSSTRTLWLSDDPPRMELRAGSTADAEFFSDILSVRTRTDDRWPEQRTPTDEYSDHYCLYANELPIGALGVTRALHGELFMQEFYPPEILERFHDRIVSAYRFRLLPEYRKTSLQAKGRSLAYSIIRETWREHLAKGARLDIINVEPKFVPYYHRLGYVMCEGYDFICPIFHEPISVMMLPADPSRRSVISDFMNEIGDYIYLDDVLAALTSTRRIAPRRAAV